MSEMLRAEQLRSSQRGNVRRKRTTKSSLAAASLLWETGQRVGDERPAEESRANASGPGMMAFAVLVATSMTRLIVGASQAAVGTKGFETQVLFALGGVQLAAANPKRRHATVSQSRRMWLEENGQ